jgi:hypothetical protein
MAVADDAHDESSPSKHAVARSEAVRADAPRRTIVEPVIVLPSPRLGERLSTPEQRLLLAVLEEAVGTYQRYVAPMDRRGQTLLADVAAWFASEATGTICDFITLCDVLGIDPSYVRSGLRKWGDARRLGPPPEAPSKRRVVVAKAPDDHAGERSVLPPIVGIGSSAGGLEDSRRSSHADVESSVRAFKGGAVDFLRKPAPPKQLIEQIRVMIGATAAPVARRPSARSWAPGWRRSRCVNAR